MKPINNLPGEWEKFNGEYEKVFYDIELKDGEVIIHCYPNAGNFHTPDGRNIDGIEVLKIRESPEENIFVWRK